MSTQNNSDESLRQDGGSISNSSRVNIELGSATIAIVVSLMLVIGACGVVMGLNMAEQRAMVREFERTTLETSGHMAELQRQYRMTELKLDDWTVVAHRSGLVLPSDYTRGPQGNPDAQSFKLKEK